MVTYDLTTGRRAAPIGLHRTDKKLLRKVGGKVHATAADHEEEVDYAKELILPGEMKTRRAKKVEEEIPTPPASSAEEKKMNKEKDKENCEREPEESDEEEKGKRKSFVRLEVQEEEVKPAAKFQAIGKRPSEEIDGEPEWTDPTVRKKQKSVHNFHAPAKSKAKGYGAPKMYGKNAQRPAQKVKKPTKEDEAPKGPTFKKLPEISNVGPTAKFVSPGSLTSRPTTSTIEDCPLDLASDNEEDPHPHTQLPTLHCPFCDEPIPRSIHEDFEDKYGKNFSFKWQRRFCSFHKRLEAETKWRERLYPEINWPGLEKRMRRHDDFLICVLNDTVDSHYREEMKGKLRPGRKSAMQSYRGGVRPGASVGYYGPRGEKVMTDHILSSLSGEIREHAHKDRLVSSAGVQGGVSGFVQAVLLPHLAEQLVKEDMKFSGDDCLLKARAVIDESAELGEVMWPEDEDKIVEVEEHQDDSD